MESQWADRGHRPVLPRLLRRPLNAVAGQKGNVHGDVEPSTLVPDDQRVNKATRARCPFESFSSQVYRIELVASAKAMYVAS